MYGFQELGTFWIAHLAKKEHAVSPEDQKHFLSESLVYTDKYTSYIFLDLNHIWMPKNLRSSYRKGG